MKHNRTYTILAQMVKISILKLFISYHPKAIGTCFINNLFNGPTFLLVFGVRKKACFFYVGCVDP